MFFKLISGMGLASPFPEGEAFNAKIRDFSRQFRGEVEVEFFLYRLCKIYTYTQVLDMTPKVPEWKRIAFRAVATNPLRRFKSWKMPL